MRAWLNFTPLSLICYSICLTETGPKDKVFYVEDAEGIVSAVEELESNMKKNEMVMELSLFLPSPPSALTAYPTE